MHVHPTYVAHIEAISGWCFEELKIHKTMSIFSSWRFFLTFYVTVYVLRVWGLGNFGIFKNSVFHHFYAQMHKQSATQIRLQKTNEGILARKNRVIQREVTCDQRSVVRNVFCLVSFAAQRSQKRIYIGFIYRRCFKCI